MDVTGLGQCSLDYLAVVDVYPPVDTKKEVLQSVISLCPLSFLTKVFYCLSNSARIIIETITIRSEGSHIQINSFFMTARPHLLKKNLTLIGETMIGVHGKKYLVVSKGASKGIPRPPFVKASRMPWLAETKKKMMK